MPGSQLAHEVVNIALAKGSDLLTYSKSKDGMLKWAVEKVERPVIYTLESSAAKGLIKVSDRVLTVADGTIDKAMATSYYKSAEAVVKTRVQPVIKNRVIPATNAVSTTVVNTTTRVTSPFVFVYNTALQVADRQVEYFLPGEEPQTNMPHKPITAVGLTVKATRRTIYRVTVVKNFTVKKVGDVKDGVVNAATYTVELAKPSSIKKNIAHIYVLTFTTADSFVDRFLSVPDNDGLVIKGPVTLVTKVAKRTTKKAIMVVQKTAMAVRNSPAAFKKVVKNISAGVKDRADKISKTTVRLKFKSYETLTPYVKAMQSKSLAIVSATDRTLLRFPLTALIRNFAVKRYENLLAPVVNRVIKNVLPVEEEKVEAKNRVEEKMLWPPSDSSEPAAEQKEPEAEGEGKKKKKKKKGKKTDTGVFC